MEGVIHNLQDQVNENKGMSTAGENVPIPKSKFFGDNPSRLLVRMSDSGMLDPELETNDDGTALGFW